MSFIICFTDEPEEHPYDDLSIAAAPGELVFGNQLEGFLAGLGEWDKSTYISHWRQSVQAVLEGADRAVLIVDYHSPERASHSEWWALYRGESEVVYVQNHLLFYDQLDREFKVEEAVSFLRDRETVSDNGEPISEWIISLRDLELFFYKFTHLSTASLSTHILDTSLGKPAVGLIVALDVREGEVWHLLHSTKSDGDGRCRPLLPISTPLTAATYRIRFDTATYFAAQHLPTLYPYVEIVFSVANPDQHYHIPLLLTANSYSTYRGS